MVKGIILSIFDMTYGYMPVHVLPKSLENDIGKEDLKTITRESIGLGGVETKTFTVDEILCVSKSFSAPMPEVRGGETMYSLTAVGLEKQSEQEWIAKVSDGAEALREIIIANNDASKPEVKETIDLWLTESSSFITPELKRLASEGSSLLADFAEKYGIEKLSKLFHQVLVRQPFLIDSSIEVDPKLIVLLSPNRKTTFLQNPSDEDLKSFSNALSSERDNQETPRTTAICMLNNGASSSSNQVKKETSLDLDEAIIKAAEENGTCDAVSFLKSVQNGWIVIARDASTIAKNQKLNLPVFDGSWHNIDKNRSFSLETAIIEEAIKEKERKQLAIISNEVLKLNAWARKSISTLWEWEMSRGDLKEQLSIDDKLLDLVEEICKGEYHVDLHELYGKKKGR